MPDLVSLVDIADYHTDAGASLRLYFSTINPEYTQRFTTYLPSEVNAELAQRMSETDLRSTLVVLARIEAALRKDYIERGSKLKLSDDISLAFRKIYKRKGRRANLNDDILDVWYQNLDPSSRSFISTLRGMLNFRHWLAHGRYWNPGAKYDFRDAYLLADIVLTSLPLCS